VPDRGEEKVSREEKQGRKGVRNRLMMKALSETKRFLTPFSSPFSSSFFFGVMPPRSGAAAGSAPVRGYRKLLTYLNAPGMSEQFVQRYFLPEIE
jgi:hypothetical protein